jgi:hypothetical protein
MPAQLSPECIMQLLAELIDIAQQLGFALQAS